MILLDEKELGDLELEPVIIYAGIESFNDLIEKIEQRAFYEVTNVCCVCAKKGPCTHLLSANLSKWCCDAHKHLKPFCISRKELPDPGSPWQIYFDSKSKSSVTFAERNRDSVLFAARNKDALQAVIDLDSRHDNEISSQFLAQVNALFAREAVDELLKELSNQ